MMVREGVGIDLAFRLGIMKILYYSMLRISPIHDKGLGRIVFRDLLVSRMLRVIQWLPYFRIRDLPIFIECIIIYNFHFRF